MLCCAFLCLVSLQISLVTIPGSKGYKNSRLKIGVSGHASKMDEKQLSSGPWIFSVLYSKGYCCIVMLLCRFDHRRVTFSHKTDVDQSVLSSIRFE